MSPLSDLISYSTSLSLSLSFFLSLSLSLSLFLSLSLSLSLSLISFSTSYLSLQSLSLLSTKRIYDLLKVNYFRSQTILNLFLTKLFSFSINFSFSYFLISFFNIIYIPFTKLTPPSLVENPYSIDFDQWQDREKVWLPKINVTVTKLNIIRMQFFFLIFFLKKEIKFRSILQIIFLV